MYTIFRTFFTQYSRRLLSILACPKTNTITTRQVGFHCFPTCLCMVSLLTSQNTCTVVQHKKKYGAHTHVHQLSQLFFSIFTSVVVYSRTSKLKYTKKTKSEVLDVFAFYIPRFLFQSINNALSLSSQKSSSIFAKKC